MLSSLIISQLIDYNCQALRNDPTSPIQIERFETISKSKDISQIKIETTEGLLNFNNVDRSNDHMNGDNYLFFVGDNFSIVLDLNENPVRASINPFAVNGKDYGPFYFTCAEKSAN